MNIFISFNNTLNSVTYVIDNLCLVDIGDYKEVYYDSKFILLTHAHFDHIYGLNRVIELNPYVKIYTNEYGREMLFNARKNLSFYHDTPFIVSDQSCIVTVEDGEEVEIGDGLKAKAKFTPGHNPSCITWIIGDCLFTGDSYIPGIKTVTNLPGGNKKQAEESVDMIKKLAVGRIIYPGHKI